VVGWVDPCAGRQGGGLGWLADEACGVGVVGVVGGGEHDAAPLVDGGGGVQAQATVPSLYQGKKTWQCCRAASIEGKRPGGLSETQLEEVK
jgi:hypothetical protein